MPKTPRAHAIPVLKAQSVRQLNSSLAAASASLKRGSVNLAAHRRALNRAKPPRPYTLRDRLSLLDKAGIQFTRPTDDLELSVRHPYVEGSGRLYFFNVSDYYTDKDHAALFMSNLGGGSFFSVTLSSGLLGARYLLDITLSGAPNLVLSKLGTPTSVAADSRGHVLIVLDAGPHLDAAISLGVTGTSMYNFHNVVVTKI